MWYDCIQLISALLNGEMKLIQNEHQIKSSNISTQELLDIKLNIRPEDLKSIENATTIIVHWFVDCHYVRRTIEFKTQEIFTEPNKRHHIEALVEASFEPAPIKSVPTITSKLITNWRTQHKSDLPFVCHNKSQIPPNVDKIYGFFETNITVFGIVNIAVHFHKLFEINYFDLFELFLTFNSIELLWTDSITDLIVNGSTWIDDGDDYHLNIYCSGSPHFEYCIHQIDGPYILEGDETCNEWIKINECQQNLKLPQSVLNVKSFTVLVIIRNPVSIERKVFVVNIKQPMILVAAVVGSIVFTMCAIAIAAFCLVRCISKKRRYNSK